MIEKERILQSGDLTKLRESNLTEEDQQPTGLVSRESLIRRLNRGPDARTRFVESHLDKSLAFQIRSLRDQGRWTQAEFAAKLGMKHPNNVSARLENPNYGKHTLTTLKNIAAACDVALVVWFIPFGRLTYWASGTPYVDKGLTPDFYNIPPFDKDPEIEHCAERVELGNVVKSDEEEADILRGFGPRSDLGCLAKKPAPRGAAGAAT
jgi:transcriptional regulator with XRE-family HTH domain